MENSFEDIHPHCAQCVKLLKCTIVPTPGESCDIVNCPLECGAKFHSCKSQEHKLLCLNEKVPCINAEYGCPAILCRKYCGRHLASCPASVIHCSEEWDRWPVHVHKERRKTPYTEENHLEPCLKNDLDVALAMRDQRMLRKWCVAAALGHSLTDQKFTISPSSSLWIFRKWQSSREYSYPPGLAQSVCNELCKTCNRTENIANNISRTGTILDNFSIDYDAYANKENNVDSNKRKETNASSFETKNKLNCCFSNHENHAVNGKCKLPQYNLDDVLQLSQFGTIVYQSSGEGSIRVAIDPIESYAACEEHRNMACQILDFKFKNPSSTPPWCMSLGLDLNLESRSQHAPSNFMYTFLCSQSFRRDEYGWHYKNIHSEIHGGLNGWLIERCPLAQYGCKFSRRKFNPAPKNSNVLYNEVLESFGVAYSSDVSKQNDENYSIDKESSGVYQSPYAVQDMTLINLPFDVLQHIVHFLDSFSLANLSLTCSVLRDVCSTVLRDHGLVHLKWEKHKEGNKYVWKPSKHKRWFFSSHITPIHEWTFDDNNNMSDHLKTCPYFKRTTLKRAFDYTKGPKNIHPNPEKCYVDSLKEVCGNTTKL